MPDFFNSSRDANDSFDSRSDDKGPEPEGVAVGEVGRRTLAFITLERIGGVMVYDVTDPRRPKFVDYVNSRDFNPDLDPTSGEAGDSGPEGIIFIPASRSPNGKALVAVAFELSGTAAVYQGTE